MRRSDATRLLAGSLLLARHLRLDRFHPFSDLTALRPLVAATVLATGLPSRCATRWVRIGSAASHLLAGEALWSVARRGRGRTDGPGELTLMALNTRDGRADPSLFARTVLENGVDLMALTEAGPRFTGRAMDHLGPHGFRCWSSVDDDRRDVDGVSLLAAPSTGDLDVRRHSDTSFPHLEARGSVLQGLRLMVFHAVAPVPPGSTVDWLADHRRIARWCRDGDVLVAGDLNSTLDHSVLAGALGGSRDAAAVAGRGLVGTWPSSLPRWAGLQLDHVLVPATVGVGNVRVLDVPGSDHRALIVSLRFGPRTATCRP